MVEEVEEEEKKDSEKEEENEETPLKPSDDKPLQEDEENLHK